MSDEVLRLRGVGIRHERSMLLREVDWTVHSDESWVIIGPNGAGKTTLLQVAAAMLVPTEGTVEILGEPAGRGAGHRRPDRPADQDRAGQRGGRRPGSALPRRSSTSC